MRVQSPPNMPPSCGTVTWLSSTMTSASRDMNSKKVGGGSPGQAAGQIARIVLDAGAGAGRLDHLDIVLRALLQPLRFEQAAAAVQFLQPDLEVAPDLLDRLQQGRARRHIMAVGVDLDRVAAPRSFRRSAGRSRGSPRSRRRTARCARRGPRNAPGRSRSCRRAPESCRGRNCGRCGGIAARRIFPAIWCG